MARGILLGWLVGVSLHAEPSVPLNVYFGNLHAHTSYSDGKGTPAEAYEYARDVAKLDFLAITEHNHLIGGDKATPEQRTVLYSGPDQTALVPTARRMTENGKFVALHGQEFSTMSKGNHVNIFDVDEVLEVPPGEFHTLLEWLKNHPDSTGEAPVFQLNHPALGGPPNKQIGKKEYGRDDFVDDGGWIRNIGGASSLIEVLNGEPLPGMDGDRSPQIMEDFFYRYLQLGFRVAPTGDQDNHRRNWGTATESRTGIIAPALSTKDILEAMRERHVYATEDKNLKLIFRVNGHLCGDILSSPPGNVTIEYSIDDENEREADYTIDVLRGTIGGSLPGVVKSVSVRGNTHSGKIAGLSLDHEGQYLLFRIIQAGEPTDRAWTAPVWVRSSTNK